MQDKFEPDPFPFLGVKEKELLKILADSDGLSEEEELKALIHVRARVLGRLKGLVDEPPVRVAQGEEYLRVKRVRIETEPQPHEESGPSHQNTTPK